MFVFGSDVPIPAWYSAENAGWKNDYPTGLYEIKKNDDDTNEKYNFFEEETTGDKLQGKFPFNMSEIDKKYPIYLQEIRVIKGHTDGDGNWRNVVGDTKVNPFGILVGRISKDDYYGYGPNKWYVIEEYVEFPDTGNGVLKQNLNRKITTDLQSGFYINTHMEGYTQMQSDSNDELVRLVPTLPIYIKNIHQAETGEYKGYLFDDKWIHMGKKKEDAPEITTSFFLIQEYNVKDLGDDLKAKTVEITQLKDNLAASRAEVVQKNAQIDAELSIKQNTQSKEKALQDEIDGLKRWRWGLVATIVFFAGLFGYLIWLHYIKKQEPENDEDDDNEFDVGDRVRVRDSKKQDWLPGEVTKLSPIKVRVDNCPQARKWKYIEYVEPSSIKVEEKPSVPQVQPPSPPKEKTIPAKKVKKPRTIIIEPDEDAHMWQNLELSQEDGIESPNPTISDIDTANFSTLESLSSIPSNFSFFTTGFTDEIENVSTLTDITPATVTESNLNQQDIP